MLFIRSKIVNLVISFYFIGLGFLFFVSSEAGATNCAGQNTKYNWKKSNCECKDGYEWRKKDDKSKGCEKKDAKREANVICPSLNLVASSTTPLSGGTTQLGVPGTTNTYQVPWAADPASVTINPESATAVTQGSDLKITCKYTLNKTATYVTAILVGYGSSTCTSKGTGLYCVKDGL